MPRPTAEQMADVRTGSCFAPDTDACWRWDGRGETLTWADGSTIAFRAEVVDVLDRLAGQGWPPFGAVVLTLAACRGGWREVADLHLARAKELAGEAARREPAVMLWFARAITGLAAVSDLPEERRATTAAKANLIARLCARSAPRWGADGTPALLTALRTGCPPATLRPRQQPWWPNLRGELYTLAVGLADLAPEAVANQERTGIELPPEPAELPPTTADQVRRLLVELTGDAECGGVARLARELLAAALVPRRLADPDVLPTGGYSDIGNRGTPDRLLIGELAHDDLVLAVRMALNEALYLRREVPPRTPATSRDLLIDTGIRLWGTARLVATAAALALAATAGPDTPIRTWRTAGRHILQTDLGSRAGVLALLADLSPEAHPGPSLAAWPSTTETACERILISHPRAIADPGFRAAWSAAGRPELLAATVDDGGGFALLALGEPGDRTLATATLDLARLLAPTGATAPRSGRDGTAIERLVPFPLRVPHPCPRERCWDLGAHGVVCALPDGRCTRWTTAGQGPVELCSGLPEGRPLLIDAVAGGFRIVLHGRPAHRLTQCIVTIDRGLGTTVLGEELAVRTVFSRHGDLVAVLGDRVMVYRADGALAAEERLNSRNWLRDRFFSGFIGDERRLLALDWDGSRLAFVEIPGMEQSALGRRWPTVFERQGLDGPWWTTDPVRVTRCDGGERIDLPLPMLPIVGRRLPVDPGWQLQEISRDGHRLLLRHQARGHSFAVDLRDGKPIHPHTSHLEAGLPPRAHLANGMLSRLRGIILDGGALGVVTLKGIVFAFAMRDGGIALHRKDLPGVAARTKPLTACGTKRQPRWRFTAADTIVELDMRGVLHLRTANAELPEAAIVLAIGQTAAWASDGTASGPATYLGERAGTAAMPLLDLLRRYAERLA